MSLLPRPIILFRGRAATLRHTYMDEERTPVSVAGLIITGALKRSRCEATPLVEFTTEGESPNIEIIEDEDYDTGVYDVTFTAADTADLLPGMYLLGYSQQSGEESDKEFFGEVPIQLVQPIDD